MLSKAAVAALLASLLACMSDAPLQRETGSVVSEVQSEDALRTAPVTLTVSCRRGSLELGSRVVAAQWDGVHVVGDTDYAGDFLRYIDANGQTGAVSISAGEMAAVPVPPGDARFECEPVGGGGNAVGGEIRVVDPEGHYRSFPWACAQPAARAASDTVGGSHRTSEEAAAHALGTEHFSASGYTGGTTSTFVVLDAEKRVTREVTVGETDGRFAAEVLSSCP